MRAAIDEATEAFLRTAGSDLRRQLGMSGRLDEISADVTEAGVVIHALVTVAHERVVLTGSGETLVDAYAALIREAPRPILASSYRQVLGDRLA